MNPLQHVLETRGEDRRESFPEGLWRSDPRSTATPPRPGGKLSLRSVLSHRKHEGPRSKCPAALAIPLQRRD